MSYEVDVIGIGQESKSGDAIAVRWGNLHGARNEQRVVLIDGGFRESGQDVVNHIKNYFGTAFVDAVISTHADQDHVNGLHVVLDQLSIGQLWIHKPWEHNRGISEKFVDGRVTDHSIGLQLRESLESAYDLVTEAGRKQVPVVEPFAGLSLYNEQQFCILGPTPYYYESLIPNFEGMPRPKDALATLFPEMMGTATRAMKRFFSLWGVDDLDNDDTTSAKNNSSVVSALTVEGRRLLFTGDAGVTALSHAADQLDLLTQGPALKFVQIPHHGSRRNVGPAILDRLIGGALPEGQSRDITAIASTAKKGEPKHPRKAVMNAFTHRGASARATRGNTIRHSHEAPVRAGWNALAADGYYWEYDDEE